MLLLMIKPRKQQDNLTLIVEENHTIPISTVGHMFKTWTYNGTVPGPTMRMTEGDLVNVTVIDSPNSKHSHSLHSGAMDGLTASSDLIAPGKNLCIYI